MSDYFRSPIFLWWIIILPALGINFGVNTPVDAAKRGVFLLGSLAMLAYYSPLSLPILPIVGPVAAHIGTHYHWITIITNIFALVAHIGEGLYAFYLCRAMKFSMLCSLKWFVQTFALGFPSLSILVKVARKRTK